MKPTSEQSAIIDAVSDMANHSSDALRKTIKIEAGAGTGKTTMLIMTTQALKRQNPNCKVLYLAFNKEIQKEAKEKFGDLAECMTIHGIAHKQLKINETKRALRRLYRKDVQSVLGTHIGSSDCDIILKTMTNFCQSGDAWPNEKNVPKSGGGGPAITSAEKAWHAEQAGRLFSGIAPDEPTKVNLPFEVYLKYWQLVGSPGLRDYNVVLFDEAQDANPVIMAALELAGNVVYVGDRHQAIYQFTGAVDAMSLSRGKSYPLSQSFRFGVSIARVANKILGEKNEKPNIPLKGSDQIMTRVEDVDRRRPHARIFRTNVMLIREAMVLYDRKTPFDIAGNNEEFTKILKSVTAMQREEPWYVYHPLVKSFKSWESLRSAAHQDDDARDLTQAVKIAEEYADRMDQIIGIISGELRSPNPLVTLTTAHRAKGREFDQVVIMPDFDEVIERVKSRPKQWDAEINLAYVAVTRAIKALEINSNFIHLKTIGA